MAQENNSWYVKHVCYVFNFYLNLEIAQNYHLTFELGWIFFIKKHTQQKLRIIIYKENNCDQIKDLINLQLMFNNMKQFQKEVN